MVTSTATDSTWWLFTLPALLPADTAVLLLSVLLASLSTALLAWALSPGGAAWRNGRARLGPVPIPGPRGLPFLGSLLALSGPLPHRILASTSRSLHGAATHLMAFSLGSTPAVVTSDPAVAREILSHSSFADRPLKRSARDLMFGRAMGFAPSGPYWRLLRRIAGTHLFSPRRIAAHEGSRRRECDAMAQDVANEQGTSGAVRLRGHLQKAALNNITSTVFGRRYEDSDAGKAELEDMVREGFDLLGAFNWSDHLPWLSHVYDHHGIGKRCAALVPRVRRFVKAVIDEHKAASSTTGAVPSDKADFVDVLLSLQGDERLDEDDMIAVLWEMIFRGTDTVALLTEWAMAELILHPDVQRKLRAELDAAAPAAMSDADLASLPYLQAVVKETLRVHPPGPLLSWARLSTTDVHLSNGMVVPANTTAMVNMWSITHDPAVWDSPEEFRPERFLVAAGGADVDVRGGDLRLAPFGAGRRVCPGKGLGLATVAAWVARLVAGFEWGAKKGEPVELAEVLKLSCEMRKPLVAVAVAVKRVPPVAVV